MRDTILRELQAVYARDPENTDSFAYDVNSFLADMITDKINAGLANRQGIINLIWANWSGGGTAEIATDNILKALDIQLPQDER